MPLSDILSAIAAQADKEVAFIQDRALKKKETIRRATDEEIAAAEEAAERQAELEKEKTRRKAETQMEMERRKAILKEKREALDHVYAAVIEELKNLPEGKRKTLEQALEKRVSGRKGEKKHSQNGGFVFVSENTDEDLTFPHLVKSLLRQQTELEVSAKLFAYSS